MTRIEDGRRALLKRLMREDLISQLSGGPRLHEDRIVSLCDVVGYDESMRLGEEVAAEVDGRKEGNECA